MCCGPICVEAGWSSRSGGSGPVILTVARMRMELVEAMATKTTKTTEKQESQATETAAPDSPLLDLSDAAVKRMIKNAKKRGYVTHEQLN